ncbi:hypothetical protein [Microtetraspora glauca]|uniref:PucR family transcriptional regulator n=1 Tax=Microtetraspora glauca TaxID=1996 RepID=A0ABV3GNG2_MICGL
MLGTPDDVSGLDGSGLRDAVLERVADWHPRLSRRLTDARDRGLPLVEAVHAYEAEMLRYGFAAVAAAAKQAGLTTT